MRKRLIITRSCAGGLRVVVQVRQDGPWTNLIDTRGLTEPDLMAARWAWPAPYWATYGLLGAGIALAAGLGWASRFGRTEGRPRCAAG